MSDDVLVDPDPNLRVKFLINSETITDIRETWDDFQAVLDQELILDKNREYGDAWQTDGPFLAISRIRDKLARVEAMYSSELNEHVTAMRVGEGILQNLLEINAYTVMLLGYMISNGDNMNGPHDAPSVVQLSERLSELRGVWFADAAGDSVGGDKAEDSS